MGGLASLPPPRFRPSPSCSDTGGRRAAACAAAAASNRRPKPADRLERGQVEAAASVHQSRLTRRWYFRPRIPRPQPIRPSWATATATRPAARTSPLFFFLKPPTPPQPFVPFRMARACATLLRLVAVVAAAVAVAAAAAPTPAAACRCPPRPPFADAVSAAVYVVRVKVTKADLIRNSIDQQGVRAEWTADVVTAYKGCLPSTISMTSGSNGGMCGILLPLTVGAEWVLLLRSPDQDGKFLVTSCDTIKAWPGKVTAADRWVLSRANDQVCPSRGASY